MRIVVSLARFGSEPLVLGVFRPRSRCVTLSIRIAGEMSETRCVNASNVYGGLHSAIEVMRLGELSDAASGRRRTPEALQ